MVKINKSTDSKCWRKCGGRGILISRHLLVMFHCWCIQNRNGKNWTQMLFNWWMDGEIYKHYGILFSCKEKWNPGLYSKQRKLEKDHIEWSNPHPEKQMLHSLSQIFRHEYITWINCRNQENNFNEIVSSWLKMSPPRAKDHVIKYPNTRHEKPSFEWLIRVV